MSEGCRPNGERKDLIEWLIEEAGIEIKTCNCGMRIFFALGKRGGKVPLGLDLVNHFATCPQASHYRRKIGQAPRPVCGMFDEEK